MQTWYKNSYILAYCCKLLPVGNAEHVKSTSFEARAIVCVTTEWSLLCWVQHIYRADNHGRPQGGKNGHFPPWKRGLRSKISRKREIISLILISWGNSCNDTLFVDTTLTLHKTRVPCPGNMQLWACSSLNPLLCLQRHVAKLGSELFYYWPLLRNNNMATKTSKMHFEVTVVVVGVLLHVTIEHRQFGR